MCCPSSKQPRRFKLRKLVYYTKNIACQLALNLKWVIYIKCIYYVILYTYTSSVPIGIRIATSQQVPEAAGLVGT